MNVLPRGNQGGMAMEGWWLSRRPYLLCRLLRDFFSVYSGFSSLYMDYAEGRGLDYEGVDRLVGSETDKGRLWELKDLCHRLWREAGDQDPHGCLFDWMVGSSFHEAMKLKENLYLRHRYAPLFGQDVGLSRKQAGFLLAGYSFRRFLDEAEREGARHMENLAFLLGQANRLLRLVAAEQAETPLFLRELCEQAEQVECIWQESLEELFTDLFPGTPETGFLLAGRSYLDGHWQDRALAAFEKALTLNPCSGEVRLLVHQARARVSV